MQGLLKVIGWAVVLALASGQAEAQGDREPRRLQLWPTAGAIVIPSFGYMLGAHAALRTAQAELPFIAADAVIVADEVLPLIEVGASRIFSRVVLLGGGLVIASPEGEPTFSVRAGVAMDWGPRVFVRLIGPKDPVVALTVGLYLFDLTPAGRSSGSRHEDRRTYPR